MTRKIKGKEQSQREYLDYVNQKAQLCEEIYLLLKSICYNNSENEIYTYDLIPFF